NLTNPALKVRNLDQFCWTICGAWMWCRASPACGKITCRQDPSFDNYIALDLEYIENWSLGLDFKILLRTIPAVFRGTGVLNKLPKSPKFPQDQQARWDTNC